MSVMLEFDMMTNDMYCPACAGHVDTMQGAVTEIVYHPKYGIAFDFSYRTFVVCLNCAFISDVNMETAALVDAPGLTVRDLAMPIVPGHDDPPLMMYRPTLFHGRRDS